MIIPEKLIVLVIDPQTGWITEHTKIIFDSIHRFILQHDLRERTVISVFSNSPASNFRSLLSWWHGFRQSDDTAIIPAFRTLESRIFRRRTYGMPPSFWKEMRKREVSDLLITGVETDASVIKTAMDAFDRGIRSWVIEDLVGSTYGDSGQNAGLSIARKVLGKDHVFRSADMFFEENQ